MASIPSKTPDLAERDPELYAKMAERRRRIAAIKNKKEREAAIDATVEFGEAGPETACRFVRNSVHPDGTPQYVDMPKAAYTAIAASLPDFDKLKWRGDGDGRGNRYVELQHVETTYARPLINAIRHVRGGRATTPTRDEIQAVIRLLRPGSAEVVEDTLAGVTNCLNVYGTEIEPEQPEGHPRLHKTLPLREDTAREVARREAEYAARMKDAKKPGGKGSRKRSEAIRDDGMLEGWLEDNTRIYIQHLTGWPLTDPATGDATKRTPYVVLHPDDVSWVSAVLIALRVVGSSSWGWTLLEDRRIKVECKRTIKLARLVWEHSKGPIPPGHDVSALVNPVTGNSNPLSLWPDNLVLKEKRGRRR